MVSDLLDRFFERPHDRKTYRLHPCRHLHQGDQGYQVHQADRHHHEHQAHHVDQLHHVDLEVQGDLVDRPNHIHLKYYQ